MAQADLITHYPVFDGILQRGVEHDVNFLTFDESHLDDALAETTAAVNLNDNSALAGF